MNIVNLTPHALNIYNEAGEHIMAVEPSSKVARCEVKRTKMDELDGVPLYTTAYGEVVDLPDACPGTIFVVSGMTRAAVPNRRDVFQPGELLRDDEGRVIGCVGLSR